MKDWNVAVTVHEHGFTRANRFLQSYGEISRTDFFNVLAMHVEDTGDFLELMHASINQDATILNYIARILPVTATFDYQSPQEFEYKAKEAVEAWISDLAGKTFHVRMHRRGFKGRLSSQDEECFLDTVLLERMTEQGEPGKINFEDPDIIIAVETIAQWAGLSLWTRTERLRYPFLKLD